MKLYEQPDLEIEKFAHEDVITTSDPSATLGPNDMPPL